MNKSLATLSILFILLYACKSNSGPDVSAVNVNITTVRYEKEFFELDTNNLSFSLDQLYNKYPDFFKDFSQHILGLPPMTDSGVEVMNAIKRFLHDYRPVYDSANKVFGDFSREEKAIIKGLKHVKYYFPNYPLPQKIFTFIGPMDAYFEASTGGYGDVITSEGLAVGLQLHLGPTFSMYSSEMGQALYPSYLARKFAPEYIPVNCLKNVVDDLYPDRSGDKTLVEQMVEKGKRIYLLQQFLPDTPDTLLIGYTKNQLEGCIKNEGEIWHYYLANNLVFNNDPSLIKNYIGDSPGTPEFGDGAPGNIGMFSGWRIVKKFMDENSSVTLDQLMKTDPRKLFEESRYRPR
jgi:hypothetical protein